MIKMTAKNRILATAILLAGWVTLVTIVVAAHAAPVTQHLAHVQKHHVSHDDGPLTVCSPIRVNLGDGSSVVGSSQADINHDCAVTASDALVVLRIAVGLEDDDSMCRQPIVLTEHGHHRN